MPSFSKRLRNAALAAVTAGAAVVVAAAPSSAADGISINTIIVRDIARIDPLPNVGEIVDADDLPSCDTPTVSYCIEVGSPVLGPVAVPNVDYDTVHVSDVVAYVHKYKVGVGSLTTDEFTCVSLVQPVASNPCAAIGIAPYETAPLVAQPVDAYIPHTTDEALTTVTVCSATMVVNGGDLTLPTFTVC
ncbi:MAG TPA: hypothetical protein VF519_01895 [Mycobacteriales bacterium]|jgi:hypothetical protein